MSLLSTEQYNVVWENWGPYCNRLHSNTEHVRNDGKDICSQVLSQQGSTTRRDAELRYGIESARPYSRRSWARCDVSGTLGSARTGTRHRSKCELYTTL